MQELSLYIPMQKREEKVQILSGWNYQENLQEEYSKDLHKSSFPWSSNKYFTFRFPNVNAMRQLFKGKFAGGNWGCNTQGFWLIEPWIPQVKPKFPKNCRYFKKAKITLQNRRKEEEEEEIHSRELFQKTSTVFAWPTKRRPLPC